MLTQSCFLPYQTVPLSRSAMSTMTPSTLQCLWLEAFHITYYMILSSSRCWRGNPGPSFMHSECCTTKPLTSIHKPVTQYVIFLLLKHWHLAYCFCSSDLRRGYACCTTDLQAILPSRKAISVKLNGDRSGQTRLCCHSAWLKKEDSNTSVQVSIHKCEVLESDCIFLL